MKLSKIPKRCIVVFIVWTGCVLINAAEGNMDILTALGGYLISVGLAWYTWARKQPESKESQYVNAEHILLSGNEREESEDMRQKYCKHCGQLIDNDCVVCPKCGKQVEQLTSNADRSIIINNSSSASAAASASTYVGNKKRKLPWYLKGSWIFILGCCTGGIYWIVGLIMRSNWKSHN